MHDNSSPNGQYVLTGSVNLNGMSGLANAMVGRMATLTLLPLGVGEIRGEASRFPERCFAKDFLDVKAEKIPLVQVMQQASYPGLVNMPNEMTGIGFRIMCKKITLEDSRHMYNLEKADYMPILLKLLAARAGNLINDADIGREIRP